MVFALLESVVFTLCTISSAAVFTCAVPSRCTDTASEIFADRAYTEEGHLVHRSLPGAVIHDAAEAAARVVRMVRAGAIETVSGKWIETPVDSICVHSDTPAAVTIARTVRDALEADGIAVRNFLK